MRIERLTLKGVTAFRDPITIDCTTLPAGLIAIIGPNGHGKTTLLESLGPAPAYREFPSRAERQLVDYATGPDSYLDQVLTLDGRGTFRLRVNLDAVHRKTDAVLEQLLPDGRAVPLNDGKATTYDAAIAPLLPSRELILASAFAAQNRAGSFVTGTRAERKALFAELLGLGAYEQKAETARQAAGAVQTRRIHLRAQLDLLEAATATEILDACDRDAQRLQIEVGRNDETLQRLAAELAAAEGAEAAAQEAVAAARERLRTREDLARRCADLETQRAALALDVEAAETARQQALVAIERRLTDALADIAARRASVLTRDVLESRRDDDLARIDARLADDLRDRAERRANNAALLEQAAEIRAAVQAVAEADAALLEARTALDELAQLIAHADAELVDVRAEARRSGDADAALRLETARRQAALLESTPCHGAAPYDGCEFLADARQALAALPALEARAAEAAERSAHIAAIDGRLTELRTRQRELDARRQLIEARTEHRAAIETRRARLEAASDRIAEIDRETAALRTRAEDERTAARDACTRGLAEAEETLRALSDDEARARTRAADETRDQLRAADERRQRLDGRLAVLQPEIDAAVAALAAQRVTVDVVALEQAVATAAETRQSLRAAHTAAVADQARITEAMAQHHARAADLRRQVTDRNTRREALARIETDLVEWQALAAALGRDGLQVLEMDAAGPIVSELTNDLLEFALGSRRFTVELVTQQAKAKGKGLKETFDLLVYDTERGNAQRSVTDLSGGEQVLIDEALKGAIALFINARNEHPIRTCWRDETTGALDPENARRYMAMLRRIQERGQFERLYVISHNPDAAALADAQLHVHDGRVDVLYPPFAEVA